MADKPTYLDDQFRQYGPELQAFIARHVQSAATAEDLTQEVFLQAQKTEKWQNIEEPRAYLFATARNRLIDHFRQRKSRQREKMLEFDEAIHGGHDISEERRLEARDELRQLAAAIRTLPPRARKAFMLNRIYRFSYAETGRMMGISPRTVENHVAKGLQMCTSLLRAAGEAPRTNNVANIADHRTRQKQER